MATKCDLDAVSSKIEKIADRVNDMSIKVDTHIAVDQDRHESQLSCFDKISGKLDKQNEQLEVYNKQLEVHMRRTATIEKILKITQFMLYATMGVVLFIIFNFLPAGAAASILSFIINIF